MIMVLKKKKLKSAAGRLAPRAPPKRDALRAAHPGPNLNVARESIIVHAQK
jgi:hypothetical protein